MQVLREALDRHALTTVLQPEELPQALETLPHPRLIVTDSQLFGSITHLIPSSISLTSFSILLAAAKGDYATYLAGLEAVESLQEGDEVLILESCLHQVSCEDIGRVKIPLWLERYTGKKLTYTFVAGQAPLPEALSRFALALQCGGCMATRRHLLRRIERLTQAGVPVTNYGMLIKKVTTPK